MKALPFFAVLCASACWAQTAAPLPSDPNTVIAIFEDGTKMTAGEFAALIPMLPDKYTTLAQQDWQRFLKVYGMYHKAAAAAESQKLGEKSPYKEGVDFAVTVALAQADYLEEQDKITISPQEIEKYYNSHKEPFRRIKVSGIKVAFSAAPAEGNSSLVNASRVGRSEEEAKAKAEKLVGEIRAGASFAQLVQSDSDDETSKAKGGDLGVWKMTDNVPDALRRGVLALQEGGVSDPIRQPGGFYIVHADAVTYTPLDEVRDFIFDQLRQEKAGKWLKDLETNTKVEFPKNDQAPSSPDPKK